MRKRLLVAVALATGFTLGMAAAIIRAGKNLIEDITGDDPFYFDDETWLKEWAEDARQYYDDSPEWGDA